MIRRRLFAILAVVVCAAPVAAGPKYDCNLVEEPDQSAAQAAGAELATTCICAEATTPSEYKRCVTGVLKTRVRAGLLSDGCARLVKTYYIPAVCGYPAGAVACARRSLGIPNTRPQCRIVKTEDACTPPSRGGRACRNVTCYAAIGDVYSGGPTTDCAQTP